MEWPVELLELFDDPILANVRPKAAAPTASDRMVAKLYDLTEWVEANGRLPQRSGGLKEKMLAASLDALRRERDALTAYDRLCLLD
jgi:hypothetical protein